MIKCLINQIMHIYYYKYYHDECYYYIILLFKQLLLTKYTAGIEKEPVLKWRLTCTPFMQLEE